MNTFLSFPHPGRPLVIAHRGYSALFPENTLPAFEAAISAGADMVEMDACLTTDGGLVILHDDTLDRTTSGSGPAVKHRLAEITALNAGDWYSPDFAGVGVPSLDEVFFALSGRIRVNLELKAPPRGVAGAGEQICLEAARAIVEHGMEESVLVSSFDRDLLIRFRELLPGVALGALGQGKENTVRALGALFAALGQRERGTRHAARAAVAELATGGTAAWRAENAVRAVSALSYHPQGPRVPAALVERFHARDVRVLSWLVKSDDRQDNWEALLAAGVDGFFTNHVERALEVARVMGGSKG
ncbi:MAG: glycerophosphodiester phosphodiesterase family protein [Pseudomonadota bacterium]